MDIWLETPAGLGVISDGNPDCHQDFRAYVVGEAEDGLDHLLRPTGDLAYPDPQRGGGDGDVSGCGAGVEPGDHLDSLGPMTSWALWRSLQMTMMAGALLTNPGTGMPHGADQARVGDDDQMPDARAGHLGAAGRVDQAIENIALGSSGVKTRCIRRRRMASNTASAGLLLVPGAFSVTGQMLQPPNVATRWQRREARTRPGSSRLPWFPWYGETLNHGAHQGHS